MTDQPAQPPAQTTVTTTQPAPPAPRALPHIALPNLHNIASALETLAFIVAAILYTINHGADQTNAVNTALFGAVFHAYNH